MDDYNSSSVATPATVSVSRSGRVVLPRPRIACPAVAPSCTVTVDTRAVIKGGRTSHIGRTTSTMAEGASRRVHVYLSRSALVSLARKGRLRATVTITAANAGAKRFKKLRTF